MKLWSDSWVNGERIPERHAAGRLDAARAADGAPRSVFGDNVSPHLAWSEVPADTRSFALICHDFDVPGRGDDVNRSDREVPADLARVDFFHWILIDIPPRMTELPEGRFSQGFTPRGKPGPAVEGASPLRQGRNDYTGWFAGDAALAGAYHGYDGPYPPVNDSLIHHYAFTVHALSIDRVPVEGAFTGTEVRQAIYPHVLAVATHSGTYTLNPRLRGG